MSKYSLPFVLASVVRGTRGECRDTQEWTNQFHASCAALKNDGHCTGTGFVAGHEWAAGAEFGNPGIHCCACGKLDLSGTSSQVRPMRLDAERLHKSQHHALATFSHRMRLDGQILSKSQHHALATYSRWLKQQVPPFLYNLSTVIERSELVREGMCNQLRRLQPPAVVRLQKVLHRRTLQSVLLRIPKTVQMDSRCLTTTREVVQEAFIWHQLSRAGHAPQVHASWMSSKPSPGASGLFLVTEEFDMTLDFALSTNGVLPGVEGQLERHFEGLARLGILAMDLKPKNQMLRRTATGSWDARLIDFQVVNDYTLINTTGLAPSCLTLYMLAVHAAHLACKHKRSAYGQRILALERHEDIQHCKHLINDNNWEVGAASKEGGTAQTYQEQRIAARLRVVLQNLPINSGRRECVPSGSGLLDWLRGSWARHMPLGPATSMAVPITLDHSADLSLVAASPHVGTGRTRSKKHAARPGAFVAPGSSRKRRRMRPHILLLIADDLGWADVGYAKPQFIRTSAISNLVRHGVELDRHYAHSLCTPSRAALHTGRLPVHVVSELTNPCDREGAIPLGMTSLAEKLKHVGYATHHVGK